MIVIITQTKLYDMKKTVLLIIFIISFANVADAQLYYQNVVMKDTSEFTMAQSNSEMEKARKLKNTGITLTVIGTSTIIIGMLLMSGKGGSFAIIPAGFAGLILDAVGISLWITGSNRTSELNSVSNYDNLNLGSLYISPAIGINQFNNTYNYGVTLSLTF